MATAHPKRDIGPRTPFPKFPDDLMRLTARRLGELGLDAELADAIRRPANKRTVRSHLKELREALCWEGVAKVDKDAWRRRPRRHSLYTLPEQQIANVRTWNAQRGWNIPEKWFTNLSPVPTWPHERLRCVTLEVALPDLPETKDGQGNTIPAMPGYIRTVREFWDIISNQHPNHEGASHLLLDAEHLFLLDGATYEPGLCWRVLDLGANWEKENGVQPSDVRNPVTSPNVDGFATLANHPRYVRRMDGYNVPYLWIAGFQVTIPGYVPRRGRPSVGFCRGDSRVTLDASWDGARRPDYSVPVRLGGGRPRA